MTYELWLRGLLEDAARIEKQRAIELLGEYALRTLYEEGAPSSFEGLLRHCQCYGTAAA